MAEEAQKTQYKEKCSTKINEPPVAAQNETCPIASDGMSRSSLTVDSCCRHIDTKTESMMCSGSSSDRPLVLSLSEDERSSSRMSCISSQNSLGKRAGIHALSSAFERASKMSIFRSRIASEHATNGTFAEKFVAWRDSATGAVDSIRKRLGVFRRTRSLDGEGEERSYIAGRYHERAQVLNKNKNLKQPVAQNESFNNTSDKVFLPNNRNPHGEVILDVERHSQSDKGTIKNGDEQSSLISNTFNDKHVTESPACDLLEGRTYVCATCVLPPSEENGSACDTSNRNNHVAELQGVTCNKTDSPTEVRIVEKQPLAEATHLTAPTVVPLEQAINPNDLTVESQNNTDVNKMARDEDSPPSTITMAQGEQQEEEEALMENKGVPRKCLGGVNLWDLRNSLEHTTIELKYINYAEDDKEEGRGDDLKASVRDVTEASPRSTPSSEFIISREKSVTDSDDNGNNHAIDAAVDSAPSYESSRSSGGDIRRNRFSGDDKIVTANVESALDLIKQKGNVVITKAIIERSPEGRDAENRSNNLMAAKERRRYFGGRRQSSLFDSNDSDVFAPERTPFEVQDRVDAGSRRSSLRVGRQSPSPSTDSNRSDHRDSRKLYNIIRFVDDGQSIELQQCGDGSGSSYSRASSSRGSPTFTSSSNSSSTHLKGCSEKETLLPNTRRRSLNTSTIKTTSMDSIVSSASSSLSYTVPHTETTTLPPTAHRSATRYRYQTKPGSSNSSATTSPSSPTGIWPYPIQFTRTRSGSEMSESDSIDSNSQQSSRSSSSLRGLSRLFRRSSTQKQQHDHVPTFCGYTMSRDYCVDVETDRIFKEFLCQDSSSVPTTPTSSEPLPPPSHMLPPRPLNRSNTTQLRRQVMRKQYSDSIAMYYGQKMRRWRFAKQVMRFPKNTKIFGVEQNMKKSDSVNCPIDRAVLRRQDNIEEDFDPEEINVRLSSTSSRRENEHPDYIPPTVNELMEWRRSSTDHTSSVSCSSRQSSTHSDSIEEKAKRREIPEKHVTFRSAKSDC